MALNLKFQAITLMLLNGTEGRHCKTGKFPLRPYQNDYEN